MDNQWRGLDSYSLCVCVWLVCCSSPSCGYCKHVCRVVEVAVVHAGAGLCGAWIHAGGGMPCWLYLYHAQEGQHQRPRRRRRPWSKPGGRPHKTPFPLLPIRPWGWGCCSLPCGCCCGRTPNPWEKSPVSWHHQPYTDTDIWNACRHTTAVGYLTLT